MDLQVFNDYYKPLSLLLAYWVVIDDLVGLFGFYYTHYHQYLINKSYRDRFLDTFKNGIRVELLGPDEVPLGKKISVKVKGKNIAFQADIERRIVTGSVMYALKVIPEPWCLGFDDARYRVVLLGFEGNCSGDASIKINANISGDFYPVNVRPYSDPWG